MIVVDNDEICAAIKDVFEDTRSILEPAGALAVAGVKSYIKKNNVDSKTFVATASGANMNFDRLGFVSERAEIGEERESIFAVTIPEKPGAFKDFCSLIGKRNITEFNYRYSSESSANIFCRCFDSFSHTSHTVFFGEVVEVKNNKKEGPLMYGGGKYLV